MMLKGEQIVCVGFPKWEGDYLKSTVQLMAELASYNEILYVDYPYTLKDLALGLKPSATAPILNILGIRPRLAEKKSAHGAAIHLLRLPPFIPANWLSHSSAYDRLLRWNAALARPFIRKAMRRLGFRRPIVINAFNPALGNMLAGQLDEKLLVYYCYDEIGAARWIGKHGKRHEEEFMRRAGLTIVSSTPLLTEKSKTARRCRLVKNGVSLNLFQQAGPPPADIPSASPGPVVGYLGSVDERLDYGLLEYLAIALPHCRFVFLGRIMAAAGAGRLEKLPNVTLLGSRPPSCLASYISEFSVGIIPFVKSRLTSGIYPLKANEYLAMGKPVVSTDFGDMSDFAGVVGLAPGYEGFRLAIEAAIASDTEARQSARRAFAQSNSWERRAALFGNLLMEALAEKPEAAGKALALSEETAPRLTLGTIGSQRIAATRPENESRITESRIRPALDGQPEKRQKK